jgi:hypothetical protein
MRLAVLATDGVDFVAVSFPPIPRGRAVALSTARTSPQIHPPVARKLVQRQPGAAMGAALVFRKPLRVRLSLAKVWRRVRIRAFPSRPYPPPFGDPVALEGALRRDLSTFLGACLRALTRRVGNPEGRERRQGVSARDARRGWPLPRATKRNAPLLQANAPLLGDARACARVGRTTGADLPQQTQALE